jgi:uncharacterized ferritin-like protein (DUF455 family)
VVVTVADACRRLLLSGSLDDKRRFPSDVDFGGDLGADGAAAGSDDDVFDVNEPARDPRLAMHDGSERLPALQALTSATARVQCLSRFAHHELMATELFAWALLRFPRAPAGLRRGWVAALREEQAHLDLYLDRLAAHGAVLGDEPLSGYFWKLLPGVRAAPDPLAAFLCMQGLTLEQANLDFTMLYRDAFARAGDVDSAAVLQRVHTDEIAHVRLAKVWLVRGDADADVATNVADDADVVAYNANVPFPLSAARAKGRRFEAGARRRAGLSDAFIRHVQEAKPYGPRTSAAPGQEAPR